MTTLGQRLRLLREERKLGQKEIANLLGISVSSVGKYENDERTPTPKAINQLSDFFKVSADFLLGRSGVRDSAEKVLSSLSIEGNLPEEALKELQEHRNYIIHKYIKNKTNR